MSLTTPTSVQKLQTALHAKAKENPACRFHALYDKVYRPDVLAHAYACCRANRGAAGVDGQTFEDIKAYGLERWLEELANELKEKRYRPQAVKRVWIPKAGQPAKLRPLGIPTGVAYCTCHSLPWGCPDDTTRIRVDWRTLSRNSASLSGSIDIQCGEPRLSFRAWIMPRSIQ